MYLRNMCILVSEDDGCNLRFTALTLVTTPSLVLEFLSHLTSSKIQMAASGGRFGEMANLLSK